jgi:hypothetical protein
MLHTDHSHVMRQLPYFSSLKASYSRLYYGSLILIGYSYTLTQLL